MRWRARLTVDGLLRTLGSSTSGCAMAGHHSWDLVRRVAVVVWLWCGISVVELWYLCAGVVVFLWVDAREGEREYRRGKRGKAEEGDEWPLLRPAFRLPEMRSPHETLGITSLLPRME